VGNRTSVNSQNVGYFLTAIDRGAWQRTWRVSVSGFNLLAAHRRSVGQPPLGWRRMQDFFGRFAAALLPVKFRYLQKAKRFKRQVIFGGGGLDKESRF
jgi:hypothetical protein